ncbi:hypothetical protein [Methanobrevibacter sp.]|uniref:hypothetical protein n=1 Tax=Methanobrevibacter sp. TaxID=66852 RepID=UPI00386701A0
MADRRINQLTESAEIADDDLFVIWKQNISQTRSIQMRNVFNVGIQSIIDRITQWTDITTDFSTTGSMGGISLTSAKYNSALKQLKLEYLYSGTPYTGNLVLQYNGSDNNIIFNDNLLCQHCFNNVQTSSLPYFVTPHPYNNTRIDLTISRNAGVNIPNGTKLIMLIQL